MKTTTSVTLFPLVIEECKKQRDRWFKKYDPQGNLFPAFLEDENFVIPRKFQDEFSAVVAGCQDPPTSVEYIGLNGCNTTSWSYNLRSAFVSKLGGNVGEESLITGCGYPIGNCAEQHAANRVLKDLEGNRINRDVSDLSFTKAVRPRTMQKIDYCLNCETLFS